MLVRVETQPSALWLYSLYISHQGVLYEDAGKKLYKAQEQLLTGTISLLLTLQSVQRYIIVNRLSPPQDRYDIPLLIGRFKMQSEFRRQDS